MIISSFPTGSDRNRDRHSHYEQGVSRAYRNRYYLSLWIPTFHLVLGIDIIGFAFYIFFRI